MCLCLFVWMRVCAFSFCLHFNFVFVVILFCCVWWFFFHSAPVGFVSGGLKKGAYEEDEEKKSGKRMHTHYAHTLSSTHYSFTHTHYPARTQAQSNATTHTPNTTHTQHHTHTHTLKKARSRLHTLTHTHTLHSRTHTKYGMRVYLKVHIEAETGSIRGQRWAQFVRILRVTLAGYDT